MSEFKDVNGDIDTNVKFKMDVWLTFIFLFHYPLYCMQSLSKQLTRAFPVEDRHPQLMPHYCLSGRLRFRLCPLSVLSHSHKTGRYCQWANTGVPPCCWCGRHVTMLDELCSHINFLFQTAKLGDGLIMCWFNWFIALSFRCSCGTSKIS